MAIRLNDLWDGVAKLLSVGLIPLTIAGMGWYWTRWQQNLSDLKSMIDLVTDTSRERQTYGIAMFEYLAKNDKVPVEFVTAAFDYVATEKNRELLPMLELAVNNAAASNPSVKAAYQAARARLPARVHIHVPDDRWHGCVVRVLNSLKDADKARTLFPAMLKVPGYTASGQEIRYFHVQDQPRAEELLGVFRGLGIELALKDLSATQWGRTTQNNSFEIWFTGRSLPPMCS